MMAESEFQDLLHAAEQLSSDAMGGGQLPRVERNLRQVLEASQELWSRVTQTGGQDTQAHVLLGSKGVDLPRLSQKLETLSARRTFEPLEPTPDTDIQSFLKNEKENAILAIVEETHEAAFESVRQCQWDSIRNDWRCAKGRAMAALRSSDPHEFVDINITEGVSHMEDETILHGRSALQREEVAFARGLVERNREAVVGNEMSRPSLVQTFWSISQELGDERLMELWEMVKCVAQVRYSATKGGPVACRNSPQFCSELVSQSRKYLEERYKTYMQSVVTSDLVSASLGSAPSTLSLVHAFASVRLGSRSFNTFSAQQSMQSPARGQRFHTSSMHPETGTEESPTIDGLPAWALVFYCLRCGDLRAALEYAIRAGSELEEVSKVLRECIDSPEGTLAPKHEMQVRYQFRRHIRNSTDPYKRAVYCILGGCTDGVSAGRGGFGAEDEGMGGSGLGAWSGVEGVLGQTSDDYLWLKLTQIEWQSTVASSTMPAKGSVGQKSSLQDLQSLVLDYGEQHYQASERPHVYVQALILTGLWEVAIEFLALRAMPRLQSHCQAVHLALALHQLNLLALPQDFKAPLLVVDPADPTPMHRLNLARLITLYVQHFEATDPREALNYYFCLRKLKGSGGEGADNLFIECVVNMVLESQDFGLILGKMMPDGCRMPGLIDELCSPGSGADFASDVAEAAGKRCEERGLFEDAIELYNLAKNDEKALSLLSVLISQVMSKGRGEQGDEEGRLRERLKMATKRIQTQRGQPLACSTETAATFHTLCKLIDFFDRYHAGKFSDALEVLEKVHLVPMSMDQLEECIVTFKRLGDEICRNMPDILLATMNILHEQYNKARGSDSLGARFDEGGRDKQLVQLRERARTITNFAGALPYRMPGDTNARLVQIEILMH
ncbi:nuclear pore complex protein Nup93-like [Ischnura elegans]|uniref:nuclear pore complex protein Nup93-like n=1 Tax=Ischnura elegans TaxID=197161 RepID=UPI001ED86F7D|nr:nuclear pore complex protein Nup93-like [Ischnura elegans]